MTAGRHHKRRSVLNNGSPGTRLKPSRYESGPAKAGHYSRTLRDALKPDSTVVRRVRFRAERFSRSEVSWQRNSRARLKARAPAGAGKMSRGTSRVVRRVGNTKNVEHEKRRGARRRGGPSQGHPVAQNIRGC